MPTTNTPLPRAEIRLEFDAVEDPSMRTRYYHFLFGFLLPALDYAARHPERKIELQSCGPVMDRHLQETFDAFGFDARVVDESAAVPVERLPRFDLSIMLDSHVRHATRRVLPRIFRRAFRRFLRGRLNLPPSRSTVRAMIERNRQRFLAGQQSPSKLEGKVLLIERSPPHPFYREGTEIQAKGYGSERRAVTNFEDLRQALETAGLDVEVFEPGVCSILDQARAFAACRAVVGIRGAELSNVIWMSRGASVVVFNPGTMPGRTPMHRLAKELGLVWHEYDTDSLELSRELLDRACDALVGVRSHRGLEI